MNVVSVTISTQELTNLLRKAIRNKFGQDVDILTVRSYERDRIIIEFAEDGRAMIESYNFRQWSVTK